MSDHKIKRFRGRISSFNIAVMAILTLIFILTYYWIYIGFLFLSGDKKIFGLILMFVLSLFGLLMLAKMIFDALGYPYVLTREGLIINNLIKRTLIPFSEINDLKKIDNEEVANMIMAIQEKTKRYYLPRGGPVITKELIDLDKYLTYAPIMGYSARWFRFGFAGFALSFFKIKILKPVVRGDFVLLNLKNGQTHLLSPKNSDAFLNEMLYNLTNINL